MYTNVSLGADALPAIINGVNKVGEAVGATMGPRGRNAIIRKGHHTYATRDGVTVADAFNLEDKQAQAGVELVQAAAREVDANNGDGTTTVTVLIDAILQEAQKQIDEGANPMQLKNQIDAAAQKVIAYIKEKSETVKSLSELEEIATVAAADAEIGALVASVVYDLGADSMVTLKDGQSSKTELELVSGVQLDSGLASPYFVRDAASQQTSFDEPHVILCDRPLRDKEDVLPMLQTLMALQKNTDSPQPAVIIAHEVTTDALGLLVLNSAKDIVPTVAVSLPAHIQNKTAYLQDIAAVTGARVVGKDNGVTLDEISQTDFGRVQSVVAGMDKTVLVRGFGDDAEVERRRTAVLKDAKDTAKNKQDLGDRLAILQGRVAIITIGGNSQTEIAERHYRFEDAVGAAKTAMRGGRVPGASTTLFGASDTIGETDGEVVLANALKYPTIQVLKNAGIYTDELFMKLGYNEAPDVTKGPEIVDLLQSGVVDPAESNIASVGVAVATAGLLMTAGSLIVDVEEQNDKTKQQNRLH